MGVHIHIRIRIRVRVRVQVRIGISIISSIRIPSAPSGAFQPKRSAQTSEAQCSGADRTALDGAQG